MADYSRSPREQLATSLARGYVGVHFEQGVALLERDLNLLGDLVLAAARIIAAGYIGNGIAAGRDGFEIQAIPAANDLRVLAGPAGTPGSCLVDGVEVTITAPLDYSDQAGQPALTTPTAAQPNPRTDTVFLDVWLADVESDEDPDLANPADVGMQTSVRVRPAWAVRVAEGADLEPGGVSLPEPDVGHAHYPLARLVRPRGTPEITATMVTDLRQRGLTLTDVETRVRDLELTVLRPRFEDAPGQTRPFTPPLGAPGTVVHIFGRNLRVGTPSVRFGAVESPTVTAPADTELTAVVPVMAPGPVTITVTTDGGSVETEDTFVVLPGAPEGDPPTLSPPPGEFSPPIGAVGTVVTISGTNLDGGGEPTVTFGEVGAEVDAFTATEITTAVPAMPSGQVRITVETAFGSVQSVNPFTVL